MSAPNDLAVALAWMQDCGRFPSRDEILDAIRSACTHTESEDVRVDVPKRTVGRVVSPMRSPGWDRWRDRFVRMVRLYEDGFDDAAEFRPQWVREAMHEALEESPGEAAADHSVSRDGVPERDTPPSATESL